MPETDSVEGSLFAARVLAGFLKVETVAEDITAALDGTGCYRRREAATLSAIQAGLFARLGDNPVPPPLRRAVRAAGFSHRGDGLTGLVKMLGTPDRELTVADTGHNWYLAIADHDVDAWSNGRVAPQNSTFGPSENEEADPRRLSAATSDATALRGG